MKIALFFSSIIYIHAPLCDCYLPPHSAGAARRHADGARRDFGCQTTLVGRHIMLSALGVAAAVAETDLTVLVRFVHEAFFFAFRD
jgi:hypothetical protein